MLEGSVEHMPQFVFILWRHQDHIGEAPQISNIEMTVMGGSVITHEPSPVNGKNNRQIGKTDIMDDLIKGPLKKGRIYCHYRPESFGGKTGGKSYRVLFRYPHV